MDESNNSISFDILNSGGMKCYHWIKVINTRLSTDRLLTSLVASPKPDMKADLDTFILEHYRFIFNVLREEDSILSSTLLCIDSNAEVYVKELPLESPVEN